MTIALRGPLLALAAALAQIPEAAPPSPFDHVVTVTIDEPFTYVPDFTGGLYLWPTWRPGDARLVLCAFDLEVDGDGGVRTSCIRGWARRGEPRTIVVRSTGAVPGGAVELHLVACPETDATNAVADRAKQDFDEIAALRDAGDLDGARRRLDATLDALLQTEGSATSDRIRAALEDTTEIANSLHAVFAVERAWRSRLSRHLRTLPDDNPILQAARGNYALALFKRGKLENARELQEQVLEILTRIRPPDSSDLNLARANLAATLHGLGDLKEAVAHQELVLAAYARNPPEDERTVLRARMNFGIMHSALGELERARSLEEPVLAAWSRLVPEDDVELQWVRATVANVRSQLGDLDGARALREQVLDVLSRRLPADHPDLQAAWNNLALTLEAQGDPAGARVLLEKLLASQSRTHADDPARLAGVQVMLAILLEKLGDLDGARTLYETAYETRLRLFPDDHPKLLAARRLLAGALRQQGDLAAARVLDEKVLDVVSRQQSAKDTDLIGAQMSLSMTLSLQGNHAAARALDEAVLAGRLKSLPEDHPEVAHARQNLAITLKALGDLAGARALEESALAIMSRRLADDDFLLQAARLNLAFTMKEQGEMAGVRALEEKVIDVFSRTLPPHHEGMQEAQRNLAVSVLLELAAHRDPAKEAEFAGLARAFTASLARRAASAARATSSRAADERAAQLKAELSYALSMAAGYGVLAPHRELEREAFLVSEASRGGSLSWARVAATAARSPEYEKARAEVAAARAELVQLAHDGASPDVMDAAELRRDSAERAFVALGTRGPVEDAGVEDFTHDLGATEALVSFRSYTRRFIDGNPAREQASEDMRAFVLRADGSLACVELGPVAAIEDAVTSWRAALSAPLERGRAAEDASDAGAMLRARGEEVRRRMFDPLRPALGDSRRLTLVLDDVLHAVPLDALPVGDLLLGDEFEIGQRLTLTELAWSDGDAPAELVEATLLAVGGASFNGAPLPLSAGEATALDEDAVHDAEGALALRGGPWERGFVPLSYTGLEARGVATLFDETFEDAGRALVLEKRKASREAVAELAPRAHFLHIATHGWFALESVRSWADPERPDSEPMSAQRMSAEQRIVGSSPMVLCGLALAGANLPADELGGVPGLLTAEEIAGWDLSNCELAVLSACDTNVGIRRAGQGVASLQKALHMAGTRSVITSLWRVPDEATMDLMLDFYRRLWVERKPKRQALWEAKMRLRDATDESGAPKYTTRDWAAWVLTGDPD